MGSEIVSNFPTDVTVERVIDYIHDDMKLSKSNYTISLFNPKTSSGIAFDKKHTVSSLGIYADSDDIIHMESLITPISEGSHFVQNHGSASSISGDFSSSENSHHHQSSNAFPSSSSQITGNKNILSFDDLNKFMIKTNQMIGQLLKRLNHVHASFFTPNYGGSKVLVIPILSCLQRDIDFCDSKGNAEMSQYFRNLKTMYTKSEDVNEPMIMASLDEIKSFQSSMPLYKTNALGEIANKVMIKSSSQPMTMKVIVKKSILSALEQYRTMNQISPSSTSDVNEKNGKSFGISKNDKNNNDDETKKVAKKSTVPNNNDNADDNDEDITVSVWFVKFALNYYEPCKYEEEHNNTNTYDIIDPPSYMSSQYLALGGWSEYDQKTKKSKEISLLLPTSYPAPSDTPINFLSPSGFIYATPGFHVDLSSVNIDRAAV